MTLARRHPLDLHIMQIVLEEVMEVRKLCFVDAGRHCEGRDFGLLLLHILWRTAAMKASLQNKDRVPSFFAPTWSKASAECLRLGGDLEAFLALKGLSMLKSGGTCILHACTCRGPGS